MSIVAPDEAHPWRATYRLQLTDAFGFDAAAELVEYVARLGASHLYLSPILESVAGSTHGYDGTDPTTVSRERGGEDGLRRLAEAAHRAGLGILADIVPNHLAASDETPWWVDETMRAKVFDFDPETGWYRRFFDIDGLAGVRQEDPEVFDLTHTKVLELVADGVIDGLRIDHPDGLTDPAGYLQRLHDAAGVPIWVEKILHPGEALRPWPVAGTVGYEFADDATALFVDPAGEAAITASYQELTGDRALFAEVAIAAKMEQLAGPFGRELDRLAELAPDVGRSTIGDAIVGFPVYRSYVDPISRLVADADRKAVSASGASAELARRLVLEAPAPAELVNRFQQTTAPVVAKGVEDTAFYRSVRLLARNEVGTDPGAFSLTVDEFHAHNLARAEDHPLGLLAATTHDTKRSADVRARIGALAADAVEFDEHVRRWSTIAGSVVSGDDQGGPTGRERWFIFQTLLGAWPITVDRLDAYLVKALREAKLTTQWVDPDEHHEHGVLDWVHALMGSPEFLADFEPFAERVAAAGERASLAQTLLRVTGPGVCDVYQGDESWFLALVDPDNRRPVDWGERQLQLDRVSAGDAPIRGTAKLHVLWHALALRSRRPELFGPASGYMPLEAGPDTVAYLRCAAPMRRADGISEAVGGEVLVVVPVRSGSSGRLSGLPGRWTDVLGADASPGTADLSDGAAVADLLFDPLGVGLWERMD